MNVIKRDGRLIEFDKNNLVGGVDSWNNAKKAELKDRVKHN